MAKQIKNLFKQKMEPRKPFEEWAKENNIDLSKKTRSPEKNKNLIKGWLTAAVSLLLIFAVTLPFLFQSNSPEQTKTYSSQDVVSESVSLEELYQIDSLLLFDQNQIMQFDRANVDIADDNESLILSYIAYNCLIATSDNANAFYIDYRIRLYSQYEFYSYQNYINLTENFTIKNTQILYKIIAEGMDVNVAYVRFSFSGLEYFLYVQGFEGVTDINLQNLTILLNDLIQ